MKHTARELISLWLPVVLWCILIFYLSSIPSLTGPWEDWDFILRKTAHILEFAVLSYLAARALAGHFSKSFKLNLLAFIFAACYAASDEFHQAFVPGRTASICDFFIDTAGCFMGIAAGRPGITLPKNRII